MNVLDTLGKCSTSLQKINKGILGGPEGGAWMVYQMILDVFTIKLPVGAVYTVAKPPSELLSISRSLYCNVQRTKVSLITVCVCLCAVCSFLADNVWCVCLFSVPFLPCG